MKKYISVTTSRQMYNGLLSGFALIDMVLSIVKLKTEINVLHYVFLVCISASPNSLQ